MAKKYPLEQLAIIKQKRLEEAERALREKKELLAQAEEKLAKVIAARDQVLKHKEDKITQLRAGLDEGLPANKIEVMRNYLKVVDEDLLKKEKQVELQKKKVTEAEEEVEKAREMMVQRQKEVEKLVQYRKEWENEMRVEEEREEGILGDEIGTARFIRDKRMRKKS
jgi:flagellar biosynthesis chaperone FliJ